MARGSSVDVWDEVWAEYDSRQAARALPAPCPALSSARPAAANARRAGRTLAVLLAAGLGVLTATAYAAMPVLAAQEISQALQANDPAAMQHRVDWPALRRTLAIELDSAALTLPPGRTGGLGSAGAAYLAEMSQAVSGQIGTAAGLAALVRGRLGLEARPEARPARLQPSLRPLSLTSAEAVFTPAGLGAGEVSLTLELRDPLRWRWQVVAVVLGGGAEHSLAE